MPSRLALARRVPRPILGFRGRAFAFGGLLAAVAVIMPRRLGASAFLLGPCGLGLVALAVLLAASFVEENGKLARVRQAARMRLGGLVPLAVSFGWALVVHEPANLLFGVMAAALAAAFIAPAVLFDLATLRDTRLGEPLWCERLGEDALELASAGGSLPVRYDSIVELGIGSSSEERGVLVTVRSRAAVSGPVPLRWIESTYAGDRFFLTERQTDADAADFAARLEAARTAGGYR